MMQFMTLRAVPQIARLTGYADVGEALGYDSHIIPFALGQIEYLISMLRGTSVSQWSQLLIWFDIPIRWTIKKCI